MNNSSSVVWGFQWDLNLFCDIYLIDEEIIWILHKEVQTYKARLRKYVFKVMASRLSSTKPLPEPKLNIYSWTLKNRLQWNLNKIQNYAYKDWNLGNKLEWNLNQHLSIFIWENEHENVICENDGDFVQVSLY